MWKQRSTHNTEENKQVDQRPHVVIIGAGFGGLWAAKALKDAAVKITIIDQHNHHLFQPLLYQVATAALSPTDIATPIRHILRHQKNTTVILAEVTNIDPIQQLVFTNRQVYAYDYLIVATGAQLRYGGHDEWEEHAPGLKSITDAATIRRKVLLAFEKAEMETDPEKIRAWLTFVLVGAGPTGIEMAGAIAELAQRTLTHDFRHTDPRSARILLVEAMPRILLSFPPPQAKKAHQALQKLGIEVRINAPIDHLDANSVTIDGERIPTHTVIWTAGVTASPAGAWLQTETDRFGRVLVENTLTIPEHSNVFVIGDTARVMQDGKPLPGLAPVAMQEGEYVANAIMLRLGGLDTGDPFHYIHHGNMVTVGRAYGLVNFGGLQINGLPGWWLWLVTHIYTLIGFRNRTLVLFQWAWSYFTYQRGSRLITDEEPALSEPDVRGHATQRRNKYR
jgi:NADH dehydrogenase